MLKLTRHSVLRAKLRRFAICLLLQSDVFIVFYSTLTFNFNRLTPKFEVFVSIPKCVSAVTVSTLTRDCSVDC